MMTKIKSIIPATKLYSTIIIIIVLLASCSHKKHTLQSTVYKTGNGYGYTISMHNKVVIKQPYIPAYSGNIPFCDSLDAANVGNLIVNKIEHKQSPTVTKNDLALLKIKTKC